MPTQIDPSLAIVGQQQHVSRINHISMGESYSGEEPAYPGLMQAQPTAGSGKFPVQASVPKAKVRLAARDPSGPALGPAGHIRSCS